MATSNYQVFGLRIQSEIELPELFSANGASAPDVTIRRGSVAANGREPGVRGDGETLVLTIPTVGRYRVAAGREIVVDAEPGIPERNIRLFLLGSAFGALLHQRGLLPLHANAIDVDGYAVAFMGESGAGKSTLAACFHDRGHRIVADDVCVVRFSDDDQAMTLPGLPRLRLWNEALEATGRSAADFARSYEGDETWDKYDVPIGAKTATGRELPLAAIYLLKRGEGTGVDPVAGLDAAEAVFAHTYRGAFVSVAGTQHGHWDFCTRLVRTTPLFRATRVWGLDRLDEQCAKLLEHIRGLRRES